MQTFTKSERLCSFSHKARLFSEGKRLFVFPFGITFMVEANDKLSFSESPTDNHDVEASPSTAFKYPCKILISAPKRIFKKATRRNKVRRLVKEAFRKNKIPFYTFLQENDLNCLLAVVYSNAVVLPYQEIEEKMVIALKRLCEEISKINQDTNC